MAETCKKCGLPPSLCICDEIDGSENDIVVEIKVETRTNNKEVTVIKNMDEYDEVDLDELRSDLQTKFGCGGTLKGDVIELQGNQKSNVEKYIEDKFPNLNVRNV